MGCASVLNVTTASCVGYMDQGYCDGVDGVGCQCEEYEVIMVKPVYVNHATLIPDGYEKVDDCQYPEEEDDDDDRDDEDSGLSANITTTVKPTTNPSYAARGSLSVPAALVALTTALAATR